MTNLEALNAVVVFTYPNPNVAIKALKDLQINPADTYNELDAINIRDVDRASIRVLMALKLLAKLEEGGYGVTFSQAGADALIKDLHGRSGLPEDPDPFPPETQPNIYNATNLW